MRVDDREHLLRLLRHAFAGRCLGHDAREIDGVTVDNDLAHARPGLETLDGHTALSKWWSDHLARRRVIRHCLMASGSIGLTPPQAAAFAAARPALRPENRQAARNVASSDR